MKNERGIAVALVLLVLAIVSLLGSGMMLQSRMNTRFSSAQKNYDKMFDMADGAALYAFNQVQPMANSVYSPETLTYPVGTGSPVSVGQWTANVMMVGYSTNPSDDPGWELGGDQGFHVEYWVAEGLGARPGGAGNLAQSVVDMAAVKYVKN